MAIDLNNLPSYDQLPVKEGAPKGSAWGLFGDDDQLGCLNLITPEKSAAAAKLVRKGAVFSLNLRLDEPSPPMYGRKPVVHHLLEEGGGVARDDYLDSFWPQASSQWDGFRHIRHPRDGFYNGVKDEEVVAGDQGKLGIEHFARKGIVTRGVLLDMERFLREQGTPLDPDSSTIITTDQLQACMRGQKVKVEQGDILLIHTGWLRWYLEKATPEQRERMGGDAMAGALRVPGIGPADEMAAYLWDLHIAAVAADNTSVEAWPPTPQTGFMHFRLLPHLGMPIGELWYLQELAADCAGDGVYEFMLTSAPLNMPGGVGSPPNALAIK
jgi:kynurenine formamidase